MTASAPRQEPTISQHEISETVDGYRCKALVLVEGQTDAKTFLLLVPVATYERIKSRQGQIGPEQIKLLFLNRIQQSLREGVLGTVPPSEDTVNLGTLDEREVDGLI